MPKHCELITDILKPITNLKLKLGKEKLKKANKLDGSGKLIITMQLTIFLAPRDTSITIVVSQSNEEKTSLIANSIPG